MKDSNFHSSAVLYPASPAARLFQLTVMSRTLVRALLVLCVPLVAPGQTPPAAPAAATAPASSNEKPFTLEDAIGMALKKNFDLQLQSYTIENAKDAIAIQEAA